MCLSIAVNRPDAVLATGTHAGHEWVVTHNGNGFRCGYVKVEPGHPWHGRNDSDMNCRVHGGLTFAQADLPCGKGGKDEGWWLGFDCCHYGDAVDMSLPTPAPWGWTDGVVRDQAYVENQCRKLCKQAAAAR